LVVHDRGVRYGVRERRPHEAGVVEQHRRRLTAAQRFDGRCHRRQVGEAGDVDGPQRRPGRHLPVHGVVGLGRGEHGVNV
jgi:hypothetical protein